MLVKNNCVVLRAMLGDIHSLDKSRSRSDDLIAHVRILNKALDEAPEAIPMEVQRELFEAVVDRIAHFSSITCPELHSQLGPYLLRYVEGPSDAQKRTCIAKLISERRSVKSAA